MEAKCLCKGISAVEMDSIKAGLPDDQTTGWLSDFFGVFADNTRLRILYFLSRSEFCVADLSSLVGLQQSAVSHQLATLRKAGFVTCRRDGKTAYYSLADAHIQKILESGVDHIQE